MASADEDTVQTVEERLQDIDRIDGATAHDPDDPDIVGILAIFF